MPTTSARDELALEIADTPARLLECKRLRYEVYCVERGFLAGGAGVEEDEFDSYSRHALVRSSATGRVFGTVRVVLPGAGCFPMQRICDLRGVPLPSTGEISRFAISRDRSGVTPAAAALVRLFLLRGIVQISGACGVAHWCATMEPAFLRLLLISGIHPARIGAPVNYHGMRQPVTWCLSDGLARMNRERPDVWQFLTNGGSWWSDALVLDTLPRQSAAGQSAGR